MGQPSSGHRRQHCVPPAPGGHRRPSPENTARVPALAWGLSLRPRAELGQPGSQPVAGRPRSLAAAGPPPPSRPTGAALQSTAGKKTSGLKPLLRAPACVRRLHPHGSPRGPDSQERRPRALREQRSTTLRPCADTSSGSMRRPKYPPSTSLPSSLLSSPSCSRRQCH